MIFYSDKLKSSTLKKYNEITPRKTDDCFTRRYGINYQQYFLLFWSFYIQIYSNKQE